MPCGQIARSFESCPAQWLEGTGLLEDVRAVLSGIRSTFEALSPFLNTLPRLAADCSFCSWLELGGAMFPAG